MRRYPTDHRLWGLISGCLFAPVATVWLLTDGVGRIGWVLQDAMYLAIGCAVVGWVLHAIAVVCGVRLTGGADPAQTADYDDAQPPPPDR